LHKKSPRLYAIRLLLPKEKEFLWRGAATKTLLHGTAAPACMEFERNRFESSQATRFNRTMGWYVGLLA
jgi:hypothetical protein